MELQSPLSDRINKEELTELHFCSLLLPTDEYSTIVVNFPETYTFNHWGEKGSFFASSNLFIDGKLYASINTPMTSSKGCIKMNFDDITKLNGENLSGLIHTKMYHSKDIPVELYFSHIHKKTGSYIAYPAAVFMGDRIFTDVHAQQLENTLFFPGLICDGGNNPNLVVLNPYPISYSYQISLFLPNNERKQSKIFKIKPHRHEIHPIAEIFAEYLPIIQESSGECTICIGAQYKIVAYMMFKRKSDNLITMLDHLHTYCLV